MSVESEATAAGQAEFESQLDEGASVGDALEAGAVAAAAAAGAAACVAVGAAPLAPVCGIAAGAVTDWIVSEAIPAIAEFFGGLFGSEPKPPSLVEVERNPARESAGLAKSVRSWFEAQIQALQRTYSDVGLAAPTRYRTENVIQRLKEAGANLPPNRYRVQVLQTEPSRLPDGRGAVTATGRYVAPEYFVPDFWADMQSRFGPSPSVADIDGYYSSVIRPWFQNIIRAFAREGIALSAAAASGVAISIVGERNMPTLATDSTMPENPKVFMVPVAAIREGFGLSSEAAAQVIIDAVNRDLGTSFTIRSRGPEVYGSILRWAGWGGGQRRALRGELTRYGWDGLDESGWERKLYGAVQKWYRVESASGTTSSGTVAPSVSGDLADGILVSPEGIAYGKWRPASSGRNGIVVSPKGIAHNLWQREG